MIGRGEPAAAEAELRQAVELAPDEAEYLGLLGVVLGMERKLQESDVSLEKALHINPGDSTTRRNLAWNQFELGQLGSAKANLELVLKDRPHDAAAILVLGMVAEELKDYPNAIRLLESVPEQAGERPQSIAALARAYYYTGREKKAREILHRLPLHSSEPEGVFLGAQIAAELHDFEDAESLFSSIWPTYPDTAKLGYSLSLVQYRAGRYPQSLATLRRLIAARHESSGIYNLLGWCLYKQDDLKGAIRALDQAITLDPADESNHLDAGMMLLDHRVYAGAMAAADKALEVAPDSYRAHRLKALVQFKIGRTNDAEGLYARAVELNPADAQAIVGLATAQLDNGNPSRAEETLKKAIERLPREALLYQGYGTMLLWGEGANDTITESRAVRLLEKAIALDASLAEPHYQLGKMALREDRTREALEQLEACVKLDPKSSKNHYALAQVYRRLGRAADAAREVQLFQSLKAQEDRVFSGPATGSATASPADAPKPAEPKAPIK